VNQDVSDEELDKARHEFLMIQFPELESWSHQIKERSSEENVVNVALDQIETDRWIKQYGDVLQHFIEKCVTKSCLFLWIKNSIVGMMTFGVRFLLPMELSYALFYYSECQYRHYRMLSFR
jgi:hypothetical protein